MNLTLAFSNAFHRKHQFGMMFAYTSKLFAHDCRLHDIKKLLRIFQDSHEIE